MHAESLWETRNMAEEDIVSFVVGIRTTGVNEKSSKMTENVINGLIEANSIMVVYLILMEETGVPGENHWLAVNHWQNWSYIVISSSTGHWYFVLWNFVFCKVFNIKIIYIFVTRIPYIMLKAIYFCGLKKKQLIFDKY